MAKRAVSSLFSVCAHIQDPKLYQPKWADACQQNEVIVDGQSKMGVIANHDVKRGQVLTLFPIHALGLRMLRENNGDGESKDKEFVAFDQDADGELFTADQKAGLRLKLNIPLDKSQPSHSILGNKKRHVLFSMFLPEKQPVSGWLGGRMKAAASQYSESNCITVPLPGAAHLKVKFDACGFERAIIFCYLNDVAEVGSRYNECKRTVLSSGLNERSLIIFYIRQSTPWTE